MPLLWFSDSVLKVTLVIGCMIQYQCLTHRGKTLTGVICFDKITRSVILLQILYSGGALTAMLAVDFVLFDCHFV